jgi:hypothetical protein
MDTNDRTDIEAWIAENRRKIALAEIKACPGCGKRGAESESHPATGVMFNCQCGARSSLDGWLAGKVELRRNPNGTYRRI